MAVAGKVFSSGTGLSITLGVGNPAGRCKSLDGVLLYVNAVRCRGAGDLDAVKGRCFPRDGCGCTSRFEGYTGWFAVRSGADNIISLLPLPDCRADLLEAVVAMMISLNGILTGIEECPGNLLAYCFQRSPIHSDTSK